MKVERPAEHSFAPLPPRLSREPASSLSLRGRRGHLGAGSRGMID